MQAEVQLQCRDTQLTPEKMKMVAPAILSKLMTSSEMDDCLDTLHTEMGEAVSDMCANFDRELVLLSQLRDSPNDLSGSRYTIFSKKKPKKLVKSNHILLAFWQLYFECYGGFYNWLLHCGSENLKKSRPKNSSK